MIRILGSLLLLIVAAVASAGDIVIVNGQQFVRTQTYGRCSNGCYGYSYSYSPYVAPAYVAPAAAYTPPATAADWKTQLLALATARDAGILAERSKALEQTYYLDAITALGLKGNFAIQGYGQNVAYGSNNFAQSFQTYSQAQPFFAPQASTVYGYSYSNLATAYGDTDINALYQAAARLTENAQKFGGDANSNFAALVDQAAKDKAATVSNIARANEIIAKAQAFATAMRSLEEKKVTIEQKGSNVTNVPPQAIPQPLPNPPPPAPNAAPQVDPLEQLGNVMAAKCASCHSGDTKKGGLDLTAWRSFDAAKKTAVWQRLVTNDNDKMMPRSKDGGSGQRLSADEIKLFLN